MEKEKKLKLTNLPKTQMTVLLGGSVTGPVEPITSGPGCPACSSCDAISNRGYMKGPSVGIEP